MLEDPGTPWGALRMYAVGLNLQVPDVEVEVNTSAPVIEVEYPIAQNVQAYVAGDEGVAVEAMLV